MIRKATLLSILFPLTLTSIASADFFFRVQDTMQVIPAAGSTNFTVPVFLVSDDTGTDIPSSIVDYQAVFDIGSATGLSDTPYSATEVTTAIDMANFVVTSPLSFADIGVAADSVAAQVVGASPAHIFNLNFTVDSTAVPTTVPITFAPNLILPGPTVVAVQTIQFDGAPMSIDIGAKSVGGNITLKAVPEPSEWILGLLMTGLLGTMVSKRFFGRKDATAKTA